MNTVLLNNELTISIPDGFRIMDQAELAGMTSPAGAPEWCISDPDRHIIISAAWKKSGFASLMLSPDEVAKKMEKDLEKMMASYGYKYEEAVSEDLGGIRAEGFRYSYKAQDIGMTGETLSAKNGKVFYYFHCYMRTELLEESIPVMDEIFQSCHWV